MGLILKDGRFLVFRFFFLKNIYSARAPSEMTDWSEEKQSVSSIANNGDFGAHFNNDNWPEEKQCASSIANNENC